MIPFDIANPEHVTLVRDTAINTHEFCGPVMTRVKEALADEGIAYSSEVDGIAFRALESISAFS